MEWIRDQKEDEIMKNCLLILLLFDLVLVPVVAQEQEDPIVLLGTRPLSFVNAPANLDGVVMAPFQEFLGKDSSA